MRIMKLKQLIASIDGLDADFDIYATPSWGAESFALVLPAGRETLLATMTVRPTFFMSVRTARALIAAERAVCEPSADELCELLVYHAVYDTPPPRCSDMGAAPLNYAS